MKNPVVFGRFCAMTQSEDRQVPPLLSWLFIEVDAALPLLFRLGHYNESVEVEEGESAQYRRHLRVDKSRRRRP